MICRDLHHFDDVLLRLKASAFTPGRENADRLLTFVAELRDIRQCAVPSLFVRRTRANNGCTDSLGLEMNRQSHKLLIEVPMSQAVYRHPAFAWGHSS